MVLAKLKTRSLLFTRKADCTKYEYDAEGNRTKKSTGTTITTYSWDQGDRLTGATTKTSGTTNKLVTVVYDAFNRRIAEYAGNGTTVSRRDRYFWDGEEVHTIANGTTTPTVTDRFLMGPGIDNTIADEKAGTINWTITDIRGSVQQVLNSTGKSVTSKDYSTFGTKTDTGHASVTDTVFAYTGREYDPDLGLQYNRNRWYDPSTQRFMSADPLGFAGGDTNLYRYVGNRPTNASDPSGLFDWQVFWNLVRADPRWKHAADFFNSLPSGGRFTVIQGWTNNWTSWDCNQTTPNFFISSSASESEAVNTFYSLIFNDGINGIANHYWGYLAATGDSKAYADAIQTALLANMTRGTVMIGSVYVQAIGALNAGGAIVIVVNDVEEGNYTSAVLGALPFGIHGAITVVRKVGGKVVQTITGSAEDLAKANKCGIKGGEYGKVRAANEGGQVHHMPAAKVTPYPYRKAPASWMETADHMKTASWGNSKAAEAYRQQQAELIRQGRLQEAIQMDINDIRSKFGNKYDANIKEMLDSFGLNELRR